MVKKVEEPEVVVVEATPEPEVRVYELSEKDIDDGWNLVQK